MNTNGGWPEATKLHGPSLPSTPLITYYQKSRHIFGDLKMKSLIRMASCSTPSPAASIAD